MQTLVIDGRRFVIEFAGFHRPLRAAVIGDDEAGASAAVELPPWRLQDHLRELRACLRAGKAGLELDADDYADAVLGGSSGSLAGLRGLALWWASGLEPDGLREPAARVDGDGWVGLDGRGTAAKLRPWTWGERLSAEQAHLHEADGLDFDAVAYLEAMVAGCLVELRGPGGRALERAAWLDLDAQASRRLLAALVQLNHPEAEGDPLSMISPAMAASTLRLCAALGWTPERVLATPAAEVQRLLLLLDKVGGGVERAPRKRATTPARRRRPSVADHPDAVVIVFAEDGEQEGGA